MQTISATLSNSQQPHLPAQNIPSESILGSAYSAYAVVRRNGSVASFEPSKVGIAITKAFIAVHGGQAAASARVRETVEQLTANVVTALMRRLPEGGSFHIESIQDQVELALMRSGEHEVARAYVLYREKRAEERAQQHTQTAEIVIHCVENGVRHPLNMQRLKGLVTAACEGLSETQPQSILDATLRDLYDGVPRTEVRKSLVLSARSMIEKDPNYSLVTARLLLDNIRAEVLGEDVSQAEMATRYSDYFLHYIQQGIEAELLDEKLGQFDLARLSAAIDPSRDNLFQYLGTRCFCPPDSCRGSRASKGSICSIRATARTRSSMAFSVGEI